MTLLTSLPRIEEHRVSVVFDCPQCKALAVRGTAYDLRETIRLADRVPAWGWSSHWVRCSHCKTELHADCSAEDFQGASPATVNNRVHAYLPFTKRFLAIASLVLGWTPGVGIILALISLAANVRTSGWPRVVSIVGLALSTVITATIFGTFIYMTLSVGQSIPLR